MPTADEAAPAIDLGTTDDRTAEDSERLDLLKVKQWAGQQFIIFSNPCFAR
jgi:hypothetical protein